MAAVSQTKVFHCEHKWIFGLDFGAPDVSTFAGDSSRKNMHATTATFDMSKAVSCQWASNDSLLQKSINCRSFYIYTVIM